MNSALQAAKREREENFPFKMAIFSTKYHAAVETLSLDTLRRITAYLASELEKFVGGLPKNDALSKVPGFSQDTRLYAGMVIIDCQDEFAAKWLKLVIGNMKNLSPDSLGGADDVKCVKIQAARPYKTFLVINTCYGDSWDMTVAKLQIQGYDTDQWVWLHSKAERSGANSFIFLDRGETFKKLSGATRQAVYKGNFNAWSITIKWLRGEDESGEHPSRFIFQTSINSLLPFKLLGRTRRNLAEGRLAALISRSSRRLSSTNELQVINNNRAAIGLSAPKANELKSSLIFSEISLLVINCRLSRPSGGFRCGYRNLLVQANKDSLIPKYIRWDTIRCFISPLAWKSPSHQTSLSRKPFDGD